MIDKNNSHFYDDMISQDYHKSKRHAWMPQIERGAQFAPFAALTGYDDAVKETLADEEAALDNQDWGYSSAVRSRWSGKPAAYVSYGSTNGSRSIDQIRQVGTQLGLIDTNSIIEIREIAARNKGETFEPNEFDSKALKAAFKKLLQYVSS